MPIATHASKITLAEMRSSGVRGLLVYCSDYRCSHSIAISAEQWPDDVRLSDLEPRFTCTACGKRGAGRTSTGTRCRLAGWLSMIGRRCDPRTRQLRQAYQQPPISITRQYLGCAGRSRCDGRAAGGYFVKCVRSGEVCSLHNAARLSGGLFRFNVRFGGRSGSRPDMP
jgi:hypothetical protein